jgi:signal transduction histidine kinase
VTAGAKHPEERAGRTRALVLLRLTLVIATGYLLIAELGTAGFPWQLAALLAVAALSNLVFLVVPSRWLDASLLSGGLILFDTLAITVALVYSGRFTTEFFFLYFFILIVAAIGENLRLIVLGAVVICVSYLAFLVHREGVSALWSVSALVRIPFLFAVASFYGYLVDRLRREREESREERVLVERLQEHQQVLEQANRRLEQEIAERMQAEDALLQANVELQRLADLKTAFVSTVSHELRTPLTAIKNAVTLLGRTDIVADDGRERRFLEIIETNTQRQLGIINDLLDLSKIEAGQLPVECASVDLGQLAGELVGSYEELARNNDQQLRLEVEADLPAGWADPQRVEQVVTNLLSNALKFSPAGSVVAIGVRARSADEIEIAVRDEGVGLSDEDREKVFEPFYQVGDAVTGKTKGTGLGLPISRDLVRAHGGDLWVESAVGAGSTFALSLPEDCAAGRERVAFEGEVREARSYPFFCVLVVRPPDGVEIPALADTLAGLLPRASDRVVAQPALGRVVVVLLGTPASGGDVVARRLQGQLGEAGVSAGVFGPSVYPEGGTFGGQLVAAALSGGDDG